MQKFDTDYLEILKSKRNFNHQILFGSLSFLLMRNSVANQMPKSLSMLVGFTPGGPNDIAARLIAPPLSKALKSTIVVDNKPGADGELAALLLMKGAADDLLLGSAGAFSISPAIKHTPYHPTKDFHPIAQIASSPLVLLVNGKSDISSVDELVTAAKKSPGKLNYSSAGYGSPTHLAGILFCKLAGVEMLHVPYKGGAPALNDLMGGQVVAYFGGVASALPLIKSGKLKALALTGNTSIASLPQVPNLSSFSNFKDYELDNWYGIFAKKGMDKNKVQLIENILKSSMSDPDVQVKFNDISLIPKFSGSEDFVKLIESDLEKWTQFSKSTKIE